MYATEILQLFLDSIQITSMKSFGFTEHLIRSPGELSHFDYLFIFFFFFLQRWRAFKHSEIALWIVKINSNPCTAAVIGVLLTRTQQNRNPARKSQLPLSFLSVSVANKTVDQANIVGDAAVAGANEASQGTIEGVENVAASTGMVSQVGYHGDVFTSHPSWSC